MTLLAKIVQEAGSQPSVKTMLRRSAKRERLKIPGGRKHVRSKTAAVNVS